MYYTVTCQTLVLQKPQFPSPEVDLLYFLDEDEILNAENYNGDVSHLEKTFVEYNEVGVLVYTDTIITTPPDFYKTYKKLSAKPVIDKLAIDKVIQTGKNTFSLFSNEDEYHQEIIYTLEDNTITKMTEDTSVYVNEVTYTCNRNSQLIKKTYFNDYGTKNISEAIYNDTGQIVSLSRYDNSDGLSVEKIVYTYDESSKLIKFEETGGLYFVTFENEIENIAINEVDYLKYKRSDTYVHQRTIDFQYNENGLLSKAAETRKVSSEENGIEEKSLQQYWLSYAPNQLIILASLPEKRKYIFTFDNYSNPKEIESFVISGEKIWLHKKTSFNISYKN